MTKWGQRSSKLIIHTSFNISNYLGLIYKAVLKKFLLAWIYLTGNQFCFFFIKIILFSLHIMFAILEGIRSSYPDFYPELLLYIFPVFQYPCYRFYCLILSTMFSTFISESQCVRPYFFLLPRLLKDILQYVDHITTARNVLPFHKLSSIWFHCFHIHSLWK